MPRRPSAAITVEVQASKVHTKMRAEGSKRRMGVRGERQELQTKPCKETGQCNRQFEAMGET